MTENKALSTRQQSVLEDPNAQAIARVYAEALLNASESIGVDTMLEEYRSFLDDVLSANPDFEKLLTSRGLGKEQKLKMVDRVLATQGSETFKNFLKVLAKNDRLDLVRYVYQETVSLQEQRAGEGRVSITSAKPLSDKQAALIKEKLSNVLPFQPVLETAVNKDLIGGLTIRVGNTVYDGSLRTRLKQLRGRLRERGLNEIQSGRDRFSHSEGN